MGKTLPILVISLLLAGPAWGQSYAKGLQAQSEADYVMALSIFRPLVAKGHTGAMYSLGQMYERGDGVPKDIAEAFRLWKLGAEKGDAVIQVALGNHYHDGRNVPQDFAEALKWYRMAAEQGSVEAQYRLGEMYLNGEGVPENNMEAYVWFSLAEVQGSLKSSRNRYEIATKLSHDQLVEANHRAEARWAEIQKHKK
jgi:hypothetical protein